MLCLPQLWMMQGQLEEHQGGMEIAREAYNKAVSYVVLIHSMPLETDDLSSK